MGKTWEDYEGERTHKEGGQGNRGKKRKPSSGE